jgi:hypothetical protein
MSESAIIHDEVLQGIARALNKAAGRLNSDDYSEYHARMVEPLNDEDAATVHAICRALWEREKERTKKTIKLFDGLPRSTTLTEACRIKAAQGDQFARQYLDFLTSKEYRIFSALWDAAVKVHPGWSTEDSTVYRKEEWAPEGDELVEWYRENFPAEARAIEDAIGPEAGPPSLP